MYLRTASVVLAFSMCLFVQSGAYAASSPTEQIKETVDKGLAIIRNPALSDDAKKVLLRETILHRIDFREFAMRALARHWRTYADRREEFIALFQDLLERLYFSKIGMLGETEVKYEKESIDGEYAEVTLTATGAKGEHKLAFRMLHRGDEWKIYDITFKGISLVGNYRSQFDKIIRTESFDELMRRLKGNMEPAPSR